MTTISQNSPPPQPRTATCVASLDWDTVLSSHPLPDTPARQAWREAIATVAENARKALPDANGRIEKAVAIVLAGDVSLLDDGTATVGSQTSTKTYQVNGSCECADASRVADGRCKHLLAKWIHKRATALAHERLTPAVAAPTWVEQATAQPMQTPGAPSIPSQFLVTIQGKEFVQYAGLLAMAHAKGLQSLSAHFISVTSELALAEATAEFTDGKTFSECAAVPRSTWAARSSRTSPAWR